MDHAVQFVQELVAQPGGLTVVPFDCIVQFLPRDGEEANLHLRRCLAIASA